MKRGIDGLFVVASGNKQIWAINPETKQKISIKPKRDGKLILDLETTKLGIFYGTLVSHKEQQFFAGNITRWYDINRAQIIDAVSGNSIITLTPKEMKGLLPEEKSKIDIDFQFYLRDDGLHYVMNGEEGVVMPGSPSPVNNIGAGHYNNKVVFGRRVIASLDEKVIYTREIKAKDLARAFRVKNRSRYDKNRDFMG